MKRTPVGGGWPAVHYAWRKSQEVGGLWQMWKALRTRNACKTCALGMGGQEGGMVNEIGGFPEVCKKSLQAMAADLQDAIRPEFWGSRSIEELSQLSSRELEACGRLAQPLLYRHGQKHYRPIEWPQAMELVVGKLKSLPARQTFWYFSGRSSNEAGFLLQLFARMYGTNNVNNCSYYCHQASGVGLNSSVGSGTATLLLEDLEKADLVFVIGGNPASNHPRMMTSLMRVRRRGGEVIVVNPVREAGLLEFRVPSNLRSLLFGTKIATLYVQPHVGGDLALITGIAKRIDEIKAQDEPFLRTHCENYDEWVEQLREITWSDIHRKSGVPQAEIDQIAAKYAAARNAVFSWTMGITHHAHGVQNVQAIANLALMRAMVGRPHAGLLPIRGHSNVQGMGSVGVVPRLKSEVFDRLQNHFGVKLPVDEGLDTLGCIEASHAGKVRLGFCLGGNLYGSNPDARYTGEALSRLDMQVSLSTTLNTGHTQGLAKTTLILPVLARDEDPQPTTQESMFNFVRLSDGGPRRHLGPRGEVEIIAEIAERVLGSSGPIDWQCMAKTGQIRQAIAQVIPGFEKIGQIDKTKEEFQIAGRTFHTPRFPTESGRAVLHSHDLPELPGRPGELRLITGRSEGQFNTVVYEEEDLYRGQDRRDVILIHPQDMERLRFTENEVVTIHSRIGSMSSIRIRPFSRIKPGNAFMYFPEANRLVARRTDPLSRTPAFKGEVVTIERS
ncbi:MAG: FdhF/YdeP family oxidoreductase [Acidobacteriota bacterium]